MNIQRYRIALVRTHMPGDVGGRDREIPPHPDSLHLLQYL